MAKRKVKNDDGAPAQTGQEVSPAPVVETPGEYVVNFRGADGRTAPVWLPRTIVIEGAVSEKDVREKLHGILDRAIFGIKRTR